MVKNAKKETNNNSLKRAEWRKKRCLNNLHVNHDLFIFIPIWFIFIYSFFTKKILWRIHEKRQRNERFFMYAHVSLRMNINSIMNVWRLALESRKKSLHSRLNYQTAHNLQYLKRFLIYKQHFELNSLS